MTLLKRLASPIRDMDMHSVRVENSGREHKHNAQADDLTNVPTMAKMCARSLLLLPPPPESIGYSLGVATGTGAVHLYSYVSVIARSNHVGAGEKDGD